MPKPHFEVGTSWNHKISQSCLSLTAYREGVYYPCGTAVFIAPLVVMSAIHTVLDVLGKYMGLNYQQNEAKPKGILTTFTIMGVHHLSGAEYEARNIFFFHDKADISILYLSPHNKIAESYKILNPWLDFGIPNVGQTVHAFGYIEPKNEDEKQLQNRIVYGNGDILVGAYAKGIIVEVHGEYRDTHTMPWPCFQTNARFDGNMSGGPIFDNFGNLIGIISSTYEPSTEDEDYASFGALLWSSMLTPMSAPLEGLKDLTYYPALALAEENIIKARGWERLLLENFNEETEEYETITYD